MYNGPKVVSDVIACGGDGVPLKRIAWLYGCAKRDSDEEMMLGTILIDQVVKRRRPA